MRRTGITNIILIIIFLAGGIYLSATQENMLIHCLGKIKSEIIPVNACNNEYGQSFMAEIIPYNDYEDKDNNMVSYAVADNKNNNDTEAWQADDNTGISESEEDVSEIISTVEIPEDADTTNIDTATVTEISENSETAVPTFNMGGAYKGPPPINYSMEQLCDFDTLISNCYVIDSSTSVAKEELDANKLLCMDMGIDMSGDAPKILIYHTHGSEAFSNSRPGTIEDTVIGVGDELERILEEEYGISVYHDRNVYDYVDGVLDRSNAYNLAVASVDKILQENPSIEVVLDIHRDGVRDDLRLVRSVDGRDTAQIMFLNGVSRLKSCGDIEYLYNPHKEENLSFSLKMFLNGRSLYGDLIRKIYIRGYCFNLDRMARASLIEVGAQTNTVEEAKNAMTPLARIIYQVLSE